MPSYGTDFFLYVNTFSNTLISHSYTRPAAALRLLQVKLEKELALDFFLGIAIPRLEGQVKLSSISYSFAGY